MAVEADRRLIHFEVHVLRGDRWTIEVTAPEESAASARARQLLQRPDVAGVKVWKELHDFDTAQSAGRVVFAEVKPRPRGRWDFRRWTSEPAESADPEPESPPRRAVAPRPAGPVDWPVAALSIGGGCAALIALAVLAALGQ